MCPCQYWLISILSAYYCRFCRNHIHFSSLINIAGINPLIAGIINPLIAGIINPLIAGIVTCTCSLSHRNSILNMVIRSLCWFEIVICCDLLKWNISNTCIVSYPCTLKLFLSPHQKESTYNSDNVWVCIHKRVDWFIVSLTKYYLFWWCH